MASLTSSFSYRVVRSRRRTVGISVGPTGDVIVRAPKWASDGRIDEMVSSMSDWIEGKRKRASASISRLKESGVHRSSLMYGGRLVPLKTEKSGSRDSLRFDGDSFLARVGSADERSVEKLYIRWLKRRAAGELAPAIQKYQRLLGVSATGISIRNQKTRWGSASKNGTVSLNCNLLKAPREVAEYVVAHELCHLRVPDHSRKFWNLVWSVFPEYKKMRKWLRENGTPLMDSGKF